MHFDILGIVPILHL